MSTQSTQARLRNPETWHGVEDGGHLLLARALDWDGNTVTQAAVTSIAYAVYDLDDNNTVVDSGALATADVIFDTPQTGGNWPSAYPGYTFRWMMPATCTPKPRLYKVQITVTPASGEVFRLPPEGWLIDCGGAGATLA